MDPFTIALGGATLLGNLFGGRSQQGLRDRDLNRILAMFQPGAISGDTNALFDAFRSSPMYSSLRNQAMSSSSLLGNQLQTSFARRGLSNSGIAGMALPIARASHVGKFQDIDAELWGRALQSIMQGRGIQANVMQNAPPSISPWGSAIGKSLDVFGPYLRTLMQGGGNNSLQTLLRSAADYNYELPQRRG